MKILLMMRTRGLLNPIVNKTQTKPATVTQPAGVKSAGGYIIYKQNNP